MSKQKVTAATHKEMIRRYPIAGLVEGWYFRTEEVSAGCYSVEGSDIYGRQISRSGAVDPEAALIECVYFARRVIAGDSHPAESGGRE